MREGGALQKFNLNKMLYYKQRNTIIFNGYRKQEEFNWLTITTILLHLHPIGH